jgi:hypothetical protein
MEAVSHQDIHISLMSVQDGLMSSHTVLHTVCAHVGGPTGVLIATAGANAACAQSNHKHTCLKKIAMNT